MPLTPIGKRQTRVVFQRLKASLTQDAAGHIDDKTESNWETYCERKCRVEYGGGFEQLVGDQLTSSNSWLLTMLSDPKTVVLDSRMRAVFRGHTCGITDPPYEIDQAGREVQLRCVEIRR